MSLYVYIIFKHEYLMKNYCIKCLKQQNRKKKQILWLIFCYIWSYLVRRTYVFFHKQHTSFDSQLGDNAVKWTIITNKRNKEAFFHLGKISWIKNCCIAFFRSSSVYLCMALYIVYNELKMFSSTQHKKKQKKIFFVDIC